jgi:fructose-bisphosphate aldolase, class II
MEVQGIYDDDFRKAITLGICKINFYTEMSTAAINKAKEFLAKTRTASAIQILPGSLWKKQSKSQNRMEVFGSKNVICAEKTLCLTCEDTHAA